MICKFCNKNIHNNKVAFRRKKIYKTSCIDCNVDYNVMFIKFIMSGEKTRSGVDANYVIEHEDTCITVSVVSEGEQKLTEYELKKENLNIAEAVEIYEKVKKRHQLTKLLK